MGTPVGPQDFSDIGWRGHWIWVPEQRIERGGFASFDTAEPGKEAHGLFRKTISLDQVPERAPARITADSRYALFVNGREASRGPIRSQPRRMHYDMLDLAPFLRAGENTFAVYVKYYGTATSAWMPAVPNMTLGKTGVVVFEADLGSAGWLVSDDTWRARLAQGWSDDWRAGTAGIIGGGVPIEVFDARRFPAGWQAAGFDDSAWGVAQQVPAVHIGGFARTQPPTDPYGPLYPRSIAQLGGETKTPRQVQLERLDGEVDNTIGSPVRRVEAAMQLAGSGAPASEQLPLTIDVATGDTARLLLDMGAIVSGLVRFELDAPAGMVFDLAYMEQPLSGPIGMLGQHAGTRYVARGEHDTFEVFDSNGLRYAYILVHGATGRVTLRSFAVREHLYPWRAGAEFSCDDDELNRIYQAGIRTVQLNSHDSFLDCPTREQRAWVGDGVVHQMVHLATNLDWRLALRYLTLGNSPRSDGILPMSVVGDIEASGGITIPDWALNWVHGVYNWYRWHGDREVVKELLPTVERVLRWYAPYQTASGTPPDVTWVDGPQVAEWAARGTLEPLDEQINAAGISADDFWTPSWNQCQYNGKVWALTLTSDANFGFYWNKGMFEDAGLDPEAPPKTIEEMDAANEKIATINNGRIERLGFIPWIVYGSSNSMFTWGWVFGGEFFDPAANKITANHPNNVKALQWMADFAKKYDATQISGFIPGLTGPGGETGPFTTRKVAMTPGGPWEIPTLETYAPDLEYGITFMPQGPGAEPNQSWVGGWTVGMPKGVKNREPAWEFLEWITTGEGTNIIWDTFGNFPGYKQSPAYEKIAQDPTKKVFYDILVETKHQRPVMPAQAFYAASLQRAVDSAIYGQKTPQQALDDASAETQKELDRILAEGVQ